NPTLWKKTAVVGFALSTIGVLFSAFLTYMSVTALHTTCEWCLGSATTMLFLFIVHGWLMQTEAPATVAKNIDWGIWGVGIVAATLGVFSVSGIMAN
ncbi:vitamin K epoxide reductase family protein, partial [Acinetobacter baumannii]